jgi:hypothetical protein
MRTHTFGSSDFMADLVKAQQESGKYPMELNSTDFHVLTLILRELALYGECSRGTRVTVAEVLGTGTDDIEPVEQWAWSLLSAIGETLGVEGI